MASSLSLILVWFLMFSCKMFSLGSNLQHKGQHIMEEAELLALSEVMSALLEDPDWSKSHPNPCTQTPYPGIECEFTLNPPIFHVTKIHIGPDITSPPCKTSAYISQSLVKLIYLKTLSIFNCFLASQVTLPETLFGPFSKLEYLALVSNPSLCGEIPQSLGDVASLRVLSLSQNSLQGKIPNEIGGLVYLEQLDLSYNNFSGQIPNEIGGLKSLTILDLSWNSIEGAMPYSLGQLQLLQKMDLHSNKLIGNMPSDLGRLKNLVLLDVSHNFFVGPIPENMSSLENLEYLIIDNNPIKGGLPLFIGKLRRLKSVSLSGCGLNGSIPKNIFSSLKNLTALSLGNNSLIGQVPRNLGSVLPNLDQLNISYNMLSGVLELPEYFIGKLGKRLDVRGNSELCILDQPKWKNLSSYLGITSCNLTMMPRRSGNFFADEDPSVIKPTCYDRNMSSCSSWLEYDQQIILFTLILNLVLVICFS